MASIDGPEVDWDLASWEILARAVILAIGNRPTKAMLDAAMRADHCIDGSGGVTEEQLQAMIAVLLAD